MPYIAHHCTPTILRRTTARLRATPPSDRVRVRVRVRVRTRRCTTANKQSATTQLPLHNGIPLHDCPTARPSNTRQLRGVK